MKAKKLIEVAMPIKEVSAESQRDKSIRHGHISTLHLWWARRPLPACRAVIFGSLVPDPLDENCPQAFKDAVNEILMHQPQYRPYKDIPYTAAYDPMEDNQRHRLMMFIGKFSDKCQRNMLQGISTSPAEQLDASSLVKWENKNNPEIIDRAQKLIWVAYNSEQFPGASYSDLSYSFDLAKNRIRECESALYSIKNRHIRSAEVEEAEAELKEAIDAFQKQMPMVLDPFAGGGAIPLEAARLGCRSYGNDINPVAHIIEKGSAEFPQKYGKPITLSKEEFDSLYGKDGYDILRESPSSLLQEKTITIPNRLAFDVEYYARKVLSTTYDQLKEMYPDDDKGNTVIAYYWARTAKCSNPSCGARVPLLRSFYLADTSSKKVYLKPIIQGTSIKFEVIKGKYNEKDLPGWNHHGNMTCPCCGSVTDIKTIKAESKSTGLTPRILALITESGSGKDYSIPSDKISQCLNRTVEICDRPTEKMEVKNNRNFNTPGWGIDSYGQLYSDRQLLMLHTMLSSMNQLSLSSDYEYNVALKTYLAIWFDRVALVNTSFSRWHTHGEKLEHMFGRQAIPMIFDYPESNPFCVSSGSGLNQLDWIIRYLESESDSSFSAIFNNASSGEKTQFKAKEITATITDPPYYDAIAYADISDFFYTWLKRTLGDVYPLNFSTPQTPKTEECTALKHHHNDDEQKARQHFEDKLTQIFDAIETQTSDVVSIMFAHQSTQAWTTLCNSILRARMNITGSWPFDTEMVSRSIALGGAALESSVTVSCRPSERKGFGDYKDVKKAITAKVEQEVESLYSLGFRGADLLTACFGQAVSEFGRYKVVEKADGSEVRVAELLEMTSKAAMDSLVKGVPGDDFSRFYVGWLYLNGMGETDFDDATKFTRVGMQVDVSELFSRRLLIREGKKQHLATAAEHLGNSTSHGTKPEDSLIDQVHRAMLAFNSGDRLALLTILHNVGADDQNAPFWRLAASLKELLPEGNDLRAVSGLLGNSDNLRQESREVDQHQPEQMTFDFGNDFNSDFK